MDSCLCEQSKKKKKFKEPAVAGKPNKVVEDQTQDDTDT